jgi:hypothetical protein
LVFLNLGLCRITSKGIRALADSPRLANLSHLEIGENNIGEEGVRALAESPHLQKLQGLNLTHTRLRKRDLSLLRERFGERLLA